MERKSNYELLRIVLFLLIICHHCIVHGIGLAHSYFDPSYVIQPHDYFWVALINALCIIAVNTFVIISGFWKIKYNLTKIIKLIGIILIYVLTFRTSYLLYTGQNMEALKSLLFITNCDYWFLKDYLLLMFFAPLINYFYENQPPKVYLTFTAVLFIVSAYFGFVQHATVNVNGYSLFQFITMYSIGRVLSIHKITLKKSISGSIYILASLTTAVMMYIFYLYDHASIAWALTFYNNPLVMIASVAFFLFFASLDFTNKRINQIGKYTLGIYLFQSSTLITSYLYPGVKDFYAAYGLPLTLLFILSMVLACFVVAIPLYALISKGMDKLIEKVQNKLQKRLYIKS